MTLANVGCGEFYAEGWVNVDTWAGHRIDVQGSILALPIETASCVRVYAGHVLEHIEEEDVPAALAEIRRVLMPGGEAMLVGPDMARMRAGSVEWEQNHAGGRRWPGDEHRWHSSGARVRELAAGIFAEVLVLPIGDVATDRWPLVSRVWWQYAVSCR